ncbi:receptor [Thalassotalea insulae]|uniref:Receptor n=1 Tax=Thalassotalea insulae TaxID=2056778 RepID=A0ABQ6GYJ5_9GAMM|nr:TonB-dependent receptor [Thalassotalea insulae]GLX80304.1 receptor [Thalassotalea insulae]
MKIKPSVLTLAVLFAISTPLVAEDYSFSGEERDDYFDDFYGSEEMVEIATGIKTQIYRAPAIASVFTAEQIKNMGATDIDDVLETVPGLHISRLSNTYTPIYAFRGVHSKYTPQVLMLINNIPITNSFLGNRNQNWGGMPVEAIARIEVIRGPGSAVFGADAFSGVINIITKNADDIKNNELLVRVGSHKTQDAWFALGDSDGEFKYSAVFEYHVTDGFDKTIEADAQTRLDKIFGTSASLAPGKLSLGTENIDFRGEINYREWTVRLGLQDRNNLGLGAGLAAALDPEADKASRRRNFDINYKSQITEDWQLDVQATYFDTSQDIDQYTIYPAGAFGGAYPNGFIGNPEVWERHTRFNITGLYSGLNNHIVRLGSGYHKGDMYKTKETKNFGLGPDGLAIDPTGPVVDVSDTPYIFLRETERSNRYVFIQDVWTVANDWELTAGLRHDDYSDFGSTTNPRLALVWSTSLNLSTKFLYGKAFRAPSFADTGNINNPVALGNPNLNPEKMETFEVAFDYHPQSGFGAILSFYDYTWTDIIQYAPDAGQSSNTAQNLGEQEGYGSELELNWRINEKFKFSGNISWSKATNDLTDADVAYVPKRQVFMQLDWEINDETRVNVKSNFINGRSRSVNDTRQAIENYVVSDINLRWMPHDYPIEFALLAKNVFDVDAREPSLNNGGTANIPNDLPLAGRTFYGEVRYKF